MGAEVFIVRSNGKNAHEAFEKAVSVAHYNYGHRGYTGTIAEKSSFIVIDPPVFGTAEEYVKDLIDNRDSRIGDKWGPAGCIKCGENEYLFFGWASS